MDEKVYHTKEEASAAINSATAAVKEIGERLEKGLATDAEFRQRMEKALADFEPAMKAWQEFNKTLPESGLSDKAVQYEMPKSFKVKIDGSTRKYGIERTADAYLCQLPAQKGSDLAMYHQISDAIKFCPKNSSGRQVLVEEARRLQKKLMGKVALDTTSESEWVPAESLSASLIDLVRENTPVANAFMRVPMPNQVTKIPTLTADATVYFMAENTASQDTATVITTSQPTAAQMTLTAKKFAVRIPSSTEQFEENAFDLASFLSTYPPILIGEAIDNVIINGDATSASATHFDTGRTVTSTSTLVAWDGLRYLCNANSCQTDASSATALTLDHIRTVIAAMGKWASPTTRGGGAIIFAPYTIALEMAALTSGYTAYSGLMSTAPIVSGAVGTILGVEVIPTQYYPTTENAVGVVSGTTTAVETGFVCANRANFKIGDRRMITVKSDEEIIYDQIETVVTWRGAFASAIGPTTTNTSAWRLYDLDA